MIYAREAGSARQADWQSRFSRYAAAYPSEAAQLQRRLKGELPAELGGERLAQQAQDAGESTASRKTSLACLNALGPQRATGRARSPVL